MKKSKLYYLDPGKNPYTTRHHGCLWLHKGDFLVSVASGEEVLFQHFLRFFKPVDNEETPAETTSDPVD